MGARTFVRSTCPLFCKASEARKRPAVPGDNHLPVTGPTPSPRTVGPLPGRLARHSARHPDRLPASPRPQAKILENDVLPFLDPRLGCALRFCYVLKPGGRVMGGGSDWAVLEASGGAGAAKFTKKVPDSVNFVNLAPRLWRMNRPLGRKSVASRRRGG
jgi:hypothetical protein